MSWGNYHVSAQDFGEVVHRLPDNWKPLTQVHSHPVLRVEHSSYDDRMVSSHRVLSLVSQVTEEVLSHFRTVWACMNGKTIIGIFLIQHQSTVVSS
jgi:hypothetical protein